MVDVRNKIRDLDKGESININLKSNDLINKIDKSTFKKKEAVTKNISPRRQTKGDDTENISDNFQVDKEITNIKNNSEKSVAENEVLKLDEISKNTNLEELENNLEKKQSEDKDKNILLPRFNRCLIFVFIAFVNVCVNLDEGNIPAAVEHIQKELKISPSQLGLFGSLQYSGNCLGKLKPSQ
jgi:hypothetical protein